MTADFNGDGRADIAATVNSSNNISILLAAAPAPSFFSGQISLSGGIYYLAFPNSTVFGYYSYVSNSIFYHFDLGYEDFIPASATEVYLYDFASGHWWYTSTSLFPYLYDFSLNTFIYYFPDTKNAGHYTANPRYFVNLTTQMIFTM